MKMKKLTIFVALVLLSTTSYSNAAEFNFKNMNTALMKLSSDYDYEAMVDSYMEAFRTAVWQKSHNDEFEMNSKRSETIEIMKKSVASYNLDDPVVISTTVQFGEYDFKEKKFALSPFEASSFFYVSYCCNKLPHTIRVFFSNPDIISGIPMDTDAAKTFLDKHKSNGNVNRQLNADISVKIKSVSSDTDLKGEIVKVVVKDPSKGNPIVLSIP